MYIKPFHPLVILWGRYSFYIYFRDKEQRYWNVKYFAQIVLESGLKSKVWESRDFTFNKEATEYDVFFMVSTKL